jgi:CubicO group peptidase (beta-lactamase class C family)
VSDIASLQRARRGITNQLLSGRHTNRRFVQPTRRKLLVRAAATAAAMSVPPSHAQAPRLANLFGGVDALIYDAHNAWEVAGLAIGIVVEGRIAHTRGFGVRKLGEPAAVDGDTVFAIASLTKSFAAVTIGQLVDAGRLGWDDRVIDHLPFSRSPMTPSHRR